VQVLEGAKLLPPVPRPGKMLCTGLNYASHQQENPSAVFPEEPYFFTKLPTAYAGPGDAIRIP
jgi:2,4-didehydro-3-deoxy-L-rhamnonate hydrolase